jgi:hypothetical protein
MEDKALGSEYGAGGVEFLSQKAQKAVLNIQLNLSLIHTAYHNGRAGDLIKH